jgi:hypothetical protein
MNDGVEIPLDQNLRFISSDIENMCSKVPTNDLIKIIKFVCSQQNHDEKLTKELIKLTRTILKQNYFKFQNSFYVQNTGLAMGAPTCSILSEIYVQYVEHTVKLKRRHPPPEDIVRQLNTIISWFI